MQCAPGDLNEEQLPRDMDDIMNRAVGYTGPTHTFDPKDISAPTLPHIILMEIDYFVVANILSLTGHLDPLGQAAPIILKRKSTQLQQSDSLDAEAKQFLEDYRYFVGRHDWTRISAREQVVQKEMYAGLVKEIFNWRKYAREIRDKNSLTQQEKRTLLNRYLQTENPTSYEDMQKALERVPPTITDLRKSCDLVLNTMQEPAQKQFLETYFTS